jgi:hypothetical protein
VKEKQEEYIEIKHVPETKPKETPHKLKVYHEHEEQKTHETLRKALGSKYDRFVAKEFMQGLAIGIIIGMILAKVLQLG